MVILHQNFINKQIFFLMKFPYTYFKKINKQLYFNIFVLFSLFVFNILNAQELPGTFNYAGNQTNTCRTDGKPDSKPIQVDENSEQIISLKNRILDIRKSGNPDQSGVIELQKQIDAITKQSVTMPGAYYPGKIIPAGRNGQNTALLNTTVLSKNNIKCFATTTEYIGTTAGRIWIVVGYEGAGSISTPDSLMVLYSTDNGTSWIPYAYIALGGTDKINFGDIDVELLEGGTNKFLYILFGLRADGGTGKWFAAGASIRLTGTYAGNLWAFTWPGDDATKRYYCPRITSDNTTWPSAPWVYIAVSFDSSGTSGRVNTQKFVQLNSPFTTTPYFTYKANKIYWVSNTETEQNLYTDIAYYMRSTDSLVISFCGVYDSTKVYFSKMSGNGAMASPVNPGQYIGPIGGSEPNYVKYGGRLSSNGNNNGSVFFIFNQKSGTTDGVKYFRTNNYGDFNTIFQSVIWTATSGVSLPDITGVRNASTHRFGFIFRGATDSLKYVSVFSDGTFLSNSAKMNLINNISTSFAPAVGLRFAAGDSCFALYSSVSRSDVWSAQGCSGFITGVVNHETPVRYSLKQNYPNPFNPSTKISFSIPKTGFVSLKIYDMLGKEVQTLLSDVKSSGNYILDFDASDLSSGIYFYKLESEGFSKTMKMLLLK
jgi:hypothetical protein